MEQQPDSSRSDSQSRHEYFSSRSARREQYLREHRPPWWPENEEWPPKRRNWHNWRGRNPFLRRLGCVFAVFNLFSFIFFVVIVGLILNAFGIIHFSFDQFQWLFPLGGLFLAFVIAMIALAGLN